MYTATFVKQLSGWSGDARLYKLSKALKPYDQKGRGHTYVIVSAIAGETYIFPAKATGQSKRPMLELPGSSRGSLSHADVLRRAGYEVTK